MPSNSRIELTALRAAAHTARWTVGLMDGAPQLE